MIADEDIRITAKPGPENTTRVEATLTLRAECFVSRDEPAHDESITVAKREVRAHIRRRLYGDLKSQMRKAMRWAWYGAIERGEGQQLAQVEREIENIFRGRQR